jgi:NADPH:quinone reductase-like Zn-dependent oxidoreductase
LIEATNLGVCPAPANPAEAWVKITEFLKSGQVKPVVAKTCPLEAAAAALRYLVEDRPFGPQDLTPRRARPAEAVGAGRVIGRK